MDYASAHVFAPLRKAASRCKRFWLKFVGLEPAKPVLDPGLHGPDDLSLTGDGGKLKLSWKGDQNRYQMAVFNLTIRKWRYVRTTTNAFVLELPTGEYMVKIRSGPMGRPPLISRWSSPLFFKRLPDNSFQQFSPQSSLIQYEVDADLLIPGRIDYSWTCIEGRTEVRLQWEGGHPRYTLGLFNEGGTQWDYRACLESVCILTLKPGKYVIRVRTGPLKSPVRIGPWSGDLRLEIRPDGSLTELEPPARFVTCSVDHLISVPGELALTAEGVADGRSGIRLSWEGEANDYQLALLDRTTQKWRYRDCADKSYATDLAPGSYLARVRSLAQGPPRRAGRWSTTVKFTIDDRGKFNKEPEPKGKSEHDGSLSDTQSPVRFVACSVDPQIPVPVEMQITAKDRADSHLGVKLSWESHSDDHQLALFNLTSKKWFYRDCAHKSYATAIEPGSYLAKVRSLELGSPRRASYWSPVVNFAVDDRMKLITGLAAKAFAEPKRQKFYDNIFKIKEALATERSTLSSNPLALSMILEGRGCNLRCIYCSHILDRGNIPPNKEFQQALHGRLLYTVGRTVGTSPTLIASLKAIVPSLQTLMFGGGEPLMYPEFKQVVTIMQDNPDTQISVCTNGNLINDELIELINPINHQLC